MRLAARETDLAELMDDPACDPERLERTLQRFDLVNRAVAGWGPMYRARLRPLLAAAPETTPRILDIGCGGGDVLRRLVRIAHRDGFALDGVGIDPDPRAISQASATAAPGVTFAQATSADLVARGERFEIVISNHLLHHLGHPELDGLISDSEQLATGLCAHADIARSRTAYALFGIAAAPLAPGSFIRVDGLRSIRRSFTRAELSARLPGGWHVTQTRPFRLWAVHHPRVGSA